MSQLKYSIEGIMSNNYSIDGILSIMGIISAKTISWVGIKGIL
jgi:hypothetical protein